MRQERELPASSRFTGERSFSRGMGTVTGLSHKRRRQGAPPSRGRRQDSLRRKGELRASG